MPKKLIIYILLSIFLMITIFSFSSKSASESNHTSKNVIKYFAYMYEKVFDKNINEKDIVEKLNFPIRKLAHFSLYFLLGIFIYHIFLSLGIPYKMLLSIIICNCFAITDEVHQLFVSGRTGQILDIFIDTLGSIITIILVKVIKKKV